PQEIRTSMYHSSFYDMLYKANSNLDWRRLVGNKEPDLHMKDVEILLRGFAMLIDGDNYSPSMVKFLNQFSRRAKGNSREQNDYISTLLEDFFDSCRELPDNAFLSKRNGRFNIALYECVFAAACEDAFKDKQTLDAYLSEKEL